MLTMVAVIAAVAANSGHDILDLAAAPGGKTLYMKSRGARVVSSDVSISRLQPLVGQANMIVTADGRRPPFRSRFETVLLDAPCSATGTIRKNPELKWRLRQGDLAGFAKLQTELLSSALSLSEKTCVYSTCSLEPEENAGQVDRFLAAHPEFRREAATGIDRTLLSDAGDLTLLPQLHGTDGAYAARLRIS
jgi:16S rRNA (cytosine967-C5)-methyltransferase